jgi:hypothetical protein
MQAKNFERAVLGIMTGNVEAINEVIDKRNRKDMLWAFMKTTSYKKAIGGYIKSK